MNLFVELFEFNPVGSFQNKNLFFNQIKMKVATVLASSVCMFLVLQIVNVHGAKILSFSFLSSKSHKITYEPLLRELARRGHQITVLSPISSKNETNFVNIPTVDPEMAFSSAPNFFEMKQNMPPWVMAIFNPFLMMKNLMTPVCKMGYDLPIVTKVLEEKWDLIFFTPLFNECLYGLIHKLNTTTIIYTQTTVPTWIADNLGKTADL